MVDWLTQYPTVTDQIEAIANVLGKEVVKELDRSFDAAHRDARRRDLADHVREVALYCLHPLTGKLVSNLTKQRLQQVLPDDWMPLTVTTSR